MAVKACLWVLCPVASLDACLSAAVVVSLDPAAVLAVSLGAWGLLHLVACLVVFHLDPVQKAWSLAVVVVYLLPSQASLVQLRVHLRLSLEHERLVPTIDVVLCTE